jgi:hypothetical protein
MTVSVNLQESDLNISVCDFWVYFYFNKLGCRVAITINLRRPFRKSSVKSKNLIRAVFLLNCNLIF